MTFQKTTSDFDEKNMGKGMQESFRDCKIVVSTVNEQYWRLVGFPNIIELFPG